MVDAAAVVVFPERPENRLRLALHRLDEALAEQSVAVAALRAGLRELDGAVTGLDRGLGEYSAALADAARETVKAEDAARSLERTAASLAV